MTAGRASVVLVKVPLRYIESVAFDRHRLALRTIRVLQRMALTFPTWTYRSPSSPVTLHHIPLLNLLPLAYVEAQSPRCLLQIVISSPPLF